MSASQDEFLGVHYRVQVAFHQRPANGSPPGASELARLSRESEEAALDSDAAWCEQYVRDWCQGNREHRLLARKPAVVPWRAWYLRCMQLDLAAGDKLQRRWRQWLREMAWDQLSAVQRLCFEGWVHELAPLVRAARAAQQPNPLLVEPNVLVYAVLSRSVELMDFLLGPEGELGAPEQLRRGETWTGFTALHVALFTRNREMVERLWNVHGANVNARDLFFGSTLDYARALGIVTNAEVYFTGERREGGGRGYGYRTLEHVVQVTLRAPHSWDTPNKEELFETRHVRDASRVFVPYWNKKARIMEHMPLAEWTDLVGCPYQPFVSASDAWLDELMFNGCYVADPTPTLRVRYAAHLTNQPHFDVPARVFMCYINASVGFACYARVPLRRGDWVCNYTGELHTDRYKWKDVERTTAFRLNFMRQIHDLGKRGEGIIKKQTLPHYARDPSYNLPIAGTSFYLNSTECGGMGRIINHSATTPNCELLVVWNAGVPQALVVALCDVARGEQLLLDYQRTFWDHEEQRRASAAASARKGGAQPERVTLWNYDQDQTLLARDARQFFRASDAVEMGAYQGFPMHVDVREEVETVN